jgi:hypothetical protein
METSPVLLRAKELVDEIYSDTLKMRFSGKKEKEQEEAEAYIELMQEREFMVAEMAELQEELSDEDRAAFLYADVMARIGEIDALDKKNREHAEKIRDSMRGTIKTAKTARQASSAYNTGEAGGISQYVDTRH